MGLLLIFVMLFSFQTFFTKNTIAEIHINQEEESSSPTHKETCTPCSVNETTASGPDAIYHYIWGWVANLSFSYYELEGYVGIPGANVTCTLAELSPAVFDLDNGTYLVEINTTMLEAEEHIPYALIVRFDKAGYENQVVTRDIFAYPIYTELTIIAPAVNQPVSGLPDLVIPLGDSIDILIIYNGTTDDETSGIDGAHVDAIVTGPTLGAHALEPVELGEGIYHLNLDTSEEWLYEFNNGIPASHILPYYLTVEVFKESANPSSVLARFMIIDIPTEIVLLSGFYWEAGVFYLEAGISWWEFSVIDNWHNGSSTQGFNVTAESSDHNALEIASITEDSSDPGVYTITLHNKARVSGNSPYIYAFVLLVIIAEKDGYVKSMMDVSIGLFTGIGGYPPPVFTGLPALIVVLTCMSAMYLRNRRKMSSAATPTGND